jgi:hypothetical protein
VRRNWRRQQRDAEVATGVQVKIVQGYLLDKEAVRVDWMPQNCSINSN